MAWYRTGTVTVTNGNATITGSGTAFIANVSMGEGFLGPDGRLYEVTNVVSDTSLTISPNYQGSGASGQGYAILPARGRIADLIAETQSLLSSFASVRDGIGAGLFPDGSAATPAFRFTSDQDTGVFRSGTNSLSLATAGVERLRITTNGNVAIGSPTADARLQITEASSGGRGGAIILANTAARANGNYSEVAFRPNADYESVIGAFIRGQSTDGTTTNPCALIFGAGTGGSPVERLRIEAGGGIRPGADNAQDLGAASFRWSAVYAGTGTINTSDEREKQWRGDLTPDELRAAKRIIGELGIYQWDDAIAEKGENGARLHFGVRAQRAFAILEDEGLDWQRYAWCCHDAWPSSTDPVLDDQGNPTGGMHIYPAGDRYGVRPDQLAFWLIAAQAAIQADLEARIAALEAA